MSRHGIIAASVVTAALVAAVTVTTTGQASPAQVARAGSAASHHMPRAAAPTAYVANAATEKSNGYLTPINTATGVVGKQIHVGETWSMAVAPGGKTVWVTAATPHPTPAAWCRSAM